ncbi:OmpA family protein [Sansalvadorimonas sp. 2012CJ34-2]|uniref:OmpA family protein n=1 Tax=Parendozoicomonas callyspongiae TaxID=2942213 RepID=A0ABT0PFN9_9GAMM|nr:OmpA family protein [Sansalvadorimonas sp. 2012CJ34-2]MCL6270081.1 OmpA family protein [Sansalvadorimonas sp. 2012CJ34-2]
MKERPTTIVVKRGIRRRTPKPRSKWKNALADFSMVCLALFIFMWMADTATPEQKAGIAGYFRTPGNKEQIKLAVEKVRIAQLELEAAATAKLNSDGQLKELEKRKYEELVARIEQQTVSLPEKISEALQVSHSPEGLRVEIRELKGRPMFARGSDRLMPAYRQIVIMLAPRLEETGSNIMVLGHTDATKFSSASRRDNWDLSSARAQKTRRALVEGGFPVERITQVVGMADRQLRDPENPNDASNRRVEIILLGNHQKSDEESDTIKLSAN